MAARSYPENEIRNYGEVVTLKLEHQFNNCYVSTAVGGAKPSQDMCSFSRPDRRDWSDFVLVIVLIFHPLSSLFIP